MLNNVHPMLALFLKLTALATVGIVVIILSTMLLKIVIIAAVIAGLILGGFFLYTYLKRSRQQTPVIR